MGAIYSSATILICRKAADKHLHIFLLLLLLFYIYKHTKKSFNFAPNINTKTGDNKTNGTPFTNMVKL